MKRTFLFAAFAAALALMSTAARAEAVGVTSGSVNLRAGPGTQHVVVVVVPANQQVVITGCLSTAAWCDVTWAHYRGWMSANYIYAHTASGQTVVVTNVYRQYPVVAPWVDARRDARVQYRVNRRWDRWLGED
jgi:uncharacterized protein YraI